MRIRRGRRERAQAVELENAEYGRGLDLLEQRTRELRAAYLARAPKEHVEEAYRAVSTVLGELIATAETGHALAVGPVEGLTPTRVKELRATAGAREWGRRVVDVRQARQAHLLAAGSASAVRVPTAVPVDGSVPLGPFWPLLDYLHITEQAPRRPVPPAPVAPLVPLPAQRRPLEAGPARREAVGAAR